MTIGLIDADLMWQKHANGRRYGKTKADIFPNLALMKLSAWHKRQGDDVEWYDGFRHFFAKMYLKKTKDVVGLADLLGHGSVDTTRIYLQKSQEEQEREYNRTITW